MNEEDLISRLEHDVDAGEISEGEAKEIYRGFAKENELKSKYN